MLIQSRCAIYVVIGYSSYLFPWKLSNVFHRFSVTIAAKDFSQSLKQNGQFGTADSITVMHLTCSGRKENVLFGWYIFVFCFETRLHYLFKTGPELST